MHQGKYIFSQITDFLPKLKFDRIVKANQDNTMRWQLSYWNHLLVLIFGQLQGCASLRELTDITVAHGGKSYHLGFGTSRINRSALSKANNYRNYHIFRKYAEHMITIAQGKRIDREFEINGRFYAFDSSTIDLCMSVFDWAKFRSTKSGIKLHTQIDIVTQIPTFMRITNACVSDVKAMDYIEYEPLAGYIFDRGYWDLSRLYHIQQVQSFFVIREKSRPSYVVEEGHDIIEDDNILKDQTVRFTAKRNKENYPSQIRRIVAYIPELRRSFTFYSNNFYLSAKQIVLLYKNRWQVELFFKFIKQHLRVKTFWGISETAVRIQIYAAIITYCLIAIIEHDLKLNRNIYEVMRILSSALLSKDRMADLLLPSPIGATEEGWRQLEFDFGDM